MSVKSASSGNCHRQNALTPEVTRHQKIEKRSTFAFDSRRLHHHFAFLFETFCDRLGTTSPPECMAAAWDTITEYGVQLPKEPTT
jgi:hypothetical protein